MKIYEKIESKYRGNATIRDISPFISEQSRVLDIGCGNGVISKDIEKNFNCYLVGTDIINYLKRDIPFTLMNEENKLPFGNKTFDVGLFNGVLHHTIYENQIILIREALRICKEVLVYEVKPSFITTIVDYGINKFFCNKEIPIPFSYRTREQWIDLFNEFYIKEYNTNKPTFWYPFKFYLFHLK